MKIPLNILTFCSALQLLLADVASAQILTHGPVVGGVTATDAHVVVRTNQAASIALQYSTDPALLNPSISNTVVTDVAKDFTANIPLTGLTSETIYYLNVLVNGVAQFPSQPFPFFATFPPAGSAREFRFVVLADFGSVAKLSAGVETFRSAAANLPAFAFIGGDFDHSNPQTLADKRQMLRSLYDPQTHFMSDFVPSILRRMPIARQWDDHDSGLSNLDKNYPDWSLTQQAFLEYTPTYPLPSVTPGIWQQFGYAQADFFVLDCRSQRDPGLDPDGPDKSMLDGNNLGATGELDWLKNGLLASGARWKIIFTSVVTNPTTKQSDGWGAYPTEWNALRSFITANNIQNVVFIAGDLHLGAIDNGAQAGFPEMCVAAANSTKTVSCPTDATGTWSEGYFLDTCAGYGLVTILQNPDRLILQVMDQNGVPHVSYTVPATKPAPITEQYGTVQETTGGTVTLNWIRYMPDPAIYGAGPYPTVVLYHGGGFSGGTPTSSASQVVAAGELSDLGYVVISPWYRCVNPIPAESLPGQTQNPTCPLEYNDAKKALRAARAASWSDDAKIAAGGGSAGGSFAVALAADVTTETVESPLTTPWSASDRPVCAFSLSGAHQFEDWESASTDNKVNVNKVATYVDIPQRCTVAPCEVFLPPLGPDLDKLINGSPIHYITTAVKPILTMFSLDDAMPPDQMDDLVAKLTSLGLTNYDAVRVIPDRVHAWAQWPCPLDGNPCTGGLSGRGETTADHVKAFLARAMAIRR